MVQLDTEYEAPINRAEVLGIISVSGWRYQRPVVNASKCCHCGVCYLFCPTGCIYDRDIYFGPDLEFCKGCGTCAFECPNDAIAMVKEEGPA